MNALNGNIIMLRHLLSQKDRVCYRTLNLYGINKEAVIEVLIELNDISMFSNIRFTLDFNNAIRLSSISSNKAIRDHILLMGV